jgi:RHS repeat-associated protein
VRTLFSTTGAKENGYTYSAYGERATGATPTGSTPFGFEGGYTDPSGLEYLVHRYYTPKVGQFLSVDPTVLKTVQAYAFANDDPVNLSDPTGLCGCSSSGINSAVGPVGATILTAGAAAGAFWFGVGLGVALSIPFIGVPFVTALTVGLVIGSLLGALAGIATYEAICSNRTIPTAPT